MNDIDKMIEQKMSRGREFRNMVEFRAVEDSDEMVVRGYATTFDKPYLLWSEDNYKVYEVIDRHAIDEADVSDVIMQYDHNGRVFARVSNATLKVAPDDFGYAVEARLDGTDIGKQLYQEIAGGYTTKMSWAFKVKEDAREVVHNEETGEIVVTRKILSVSKVYDVSAVSIPANDATVISARSFGEGVVADVREEIAKAEAAKEIRRKKIQLIKTLAEV